MGTYQGPGSARYGRSGMPVAAIMELRLGFRMHGFDVSTYADDEISGAIAAEAMTSTDPTRDLFSGAFERLRSS